MHLRQFEMMISKVQFYTFAAAVPLLVFYLVWNRPCAISHPRLEIMNFSNSVKSESKYLPLVDITPALTGEDTQIFQKTFNSSNKVCVKFYAFNLLTENGHLFGQIKELITSEISS